MIRSKKLADEATSVYTHGKEFAYDHIMRETVVLFAKNTDTRLNIRINPQFRSLRGILLLYIDPYRAGTKDSEKYINPDIIKVHVTVNGSPNRVYNEGIGATDMWKEISRFFATKSRKSVGSYDRPNMNPTKYLTDNKFGLLVDLRSIADTTMHCSGQRLVNTKDGVQLQIERTGTGSGSTNCHVFVISDAQMNIMER